MSQSDMRSHGALTTTIGVLAISMLMLLPLSMATGMRFTISSQLPGVAAAGVSTAPHQSPGIPETPLQNPTLPSSEDPSWLDSALGTSAPLSAQVNPYQVYSTEPAPMGITDYGLNRTGSAQQYGTDEFLGVAAISSLSVQGTQEHVCSLFGTTLSLQLNAILLFYVGNTPYYYFVQDVVGLETLSSSSSTITYWDNIWNATASTASIGSGSVQGNGTVSSGSYSDCASSSLSGNYVTLQYPATVKLQVNELLSNNVPEVVFSYYSTVTSKRVIYDNVVFPWAKNAASYQFWVSGTSYNPAQGFNDAELVFGGACCRDSTKFQSSSSVSMYLEYHGDYGGTTLLEYVPDAYNFGSNTAERVWSVSGTSLQGPVGVSLTYVSPSGSLAQVYWSDELRFHTNSSVPGNLAWNVQLSGSNLLNPFDLPAWGNGGNTTVPDGTYSWTILPPTGWIATPSSGQVTVSGTKTVFFTMQQQGGGCVAYGTPILTPSGYVPVQNLKPGATVEEYDFSTQSVVPGTLLWGNATNETQLVDINRGLLLLTPADQPVYIQNNTFEGWLRDPQNLTTADTMFDPVTMSWIHVTSVKLIHDHTTVFDVVTNGWNDFVADGVLLDMKA